jgi:cytoskeletal protein RodZ
LAGPDPEHLLHFVVFLCGVLGGVVPLGSGWWGQPDLLFFTEGLPSWVAGLLVVAIHIIAIAAIIGGTLVFLSAAASRIVLLSSSVAWLILVAVLGHGVTPVAALLIILIAIGGFTAFLPSVQQPLLSLRDPGSLPLWHAREQSAERVPLFGRERKPRRDVAVGRRTEPAFGETPATATYSSDFAIGPSPTRRSRAKVRRDRRRSILGVVGLIGLMAVLFGIVVLNSQVFTPDTARVLDSPSSGPVVSQPSSAAVSVAEVSSASSSAAPPPSSAAKSSAIANPASSVSAEERLPSQALGLPQQYASLPPITAPGLPPSSESASAPPSPAAASATDQFSSLPPIASASSAEMSVASASAAQPLPSRFATPAEYCSAVANTAAPEASKITGGLAAMTTAARTQAAMPQGEVRWRCMDNAVWVCVQPSGSLSCDKVPSSVDRVLICAAHPDTQGIRTAGGDWSCNGFTPVVSKDQIDAPDHRGFDRSAWHTLKGDPDPPAH